MKQFIQLVIISIFFGSSACASSSGNEPNGGYVLNLPTDQEIDTATFAGGCFWCIEAAFEQVIGVHEAVSGYSGGKKEDATYKKVSYGVTGHAEAVQVYYDPTLITYTQLVQIFFVAHDPTQFNRQGPDVGPQYRSAIFYHNAAQKEIAENVIQQLADDFDDPIVTQINPLEGFYIAETYHQDYEKKNPFNPYIQNVSRPKIDRVKYTFDELIKSENKQE